MLRVKKMELIAFVLFVLGGFAVFGENQGYGSKGIDSAAGMTIEEMLIHAIQDEYLARSEYALIIKKYGLIRPFSNIIRAEENHITWVSEILLKNGYIVPKDSSNDYIVLPTSMKAALETGVQAEIDNIAMYEKFLNRSDLPKDVRFLFQKLRNASKNHLRAFQNNLRRYR